MHKADTLTGAYFLSNSLPQPKENIFKLSTKNLRCFSTATATESDFTSWFSDCLPLRFSSSNPYFNKSLLLNESYIVSPLASQQWGFCSKRSTVSALLDAVNNWQQAFDNGKEVCAIFFDLRKAFDSVPHSILLNKVKSLGFNEHILKLISFLSLQQATICCT